MSQRMEESPDHSHRKYLERQMDPFLGLNAKRGQSQIKRPNIVTNISSPDVSIISNMQTNAIDSDDKKATI